MLPFFKLEIKTFAAVKETLTGVKSSLYNTSLYMSQLYFSIAHT